MKKTKFTPDYLLSLIPDQYNANINDKDLILSTENNFLSLDTRLIIDIKIEEVTVKLTIRVNKTYNIITLWKNCTHIHNIIFKI